MLDLELHSHTRWSPDSLSKIEDVIAHIDKIGIDRIAITDHSEIEGALRAHKLAPTKIIVGEEVMTSDGELLCYFILELIPPYLSPRETCDIVHAQGGIIGPSHPFDPRRSGLGRANLLKIADHIDFIEVFNARTRDHSKNDLARALAIELNKPMICASDAHTLPEIGISRTRLKRDYTSPHDFLAAVREAELVTHYSPPTVAIGSRVAAAVHGLGLAKPE
jgi:predicted metal-dependent phosphoesterase TrpH